MTTEHGKHNRVFPAQADNTPIETAVRMLRASEDVLADVAETLYFKKRVGPKTRAELRRKLAGVIASVETVRIAIVE